MSSNESIKVSNSSPRNKLSSYYDCYPLQLVNVQNNTSYKVGHTEMWRSQNAGNKMSANENFMASLDLIYQVMISVGRSQYKSDGY